MEKTILELDQVASILKALGGQTRLMILGLLQEDECCVCEFVEIFQMSQPAISQHLKKLKELGLVKEEKRSQWVYYSLNKESKSYELLKDLLKHLPSQKDKLDELTRKGVRNQCE